MHRLTASLRYSLGFLLTSRSGASSRANTPLLTSMIVLGGAIACTQGGAQSKVDDVNAASISSSKIAKAGGSEAKIYTHFPNVEMSGLGEAERLMFLQIVNEEICPCSCPKSFAACLQAGTKCQPAVILANWMVSELREGVPGEIIADQVTKEISSGFSAKPKRINVAGFASKGPSNASMTIVEYADFECGHCKAVSPVVAALAKKYPKEIRVVFKHFPLSFHKMAAPAARAAEAAGNQGKFWEMHDAIFATQAMLDEDLLMGHARALGLHMERFTTDFKGADLKHKVDGSRTEGEAVGVEATPSFFFNGRPFNLMRTPEAFEARIKMERARSSARCN